MKKKLVLKTEWKIVLMILPICMILAGLIAFVIKEDQHFVENCMNNGYSRYYCESHR